MNYLNKEQIEQNLSYIQNFIAEKIEPHDPFGLKAKLADTSAMLGLSVEVQASCKFLLEDKKKEVFANPEVQSSLFKLSSTLQRQLVDSYLADNLAMYELAQRQNAYLTHSIDAIRTLISFAKSEMEQSKFART